MVDQNMIDAFNSLMVKLDNDPVRDIAQRMIEDVAQYLLEGSENLIALCSRVDFKMKIADFSTFLEDQGLLGWEIDIPPKRPDPAPTQSTASSLPTLPKRWINPKKGTSSKVKRSASKLHQNAFRKQVSTARVFKKKKRSSTKRKNVWINLDAENTPKEQELVSDGKFHCPQPNCHESFRDREAYKFHLYTHTRGYRKDFQK